jgi:hypothetical protein
MIIVLLFTTFFSSTLLEQDLIENHISVVPSAPPLYDAGSGFDSFLSQEPIVQAEIVEDSSISVPVAVAEEIPNDRALGSLSCFNTYLFPKDFNQMKRDVVEPDFNDVAGIILEIDDSAAPKIPDLVNFLNSDLLLRLKFLNADGSPSFTLRLVYSQDELLTPLLNDMDLGDLLTVSILLDKQLHTAMNEDEIASILHKYPLRWKDGRIRTFVIHRAKSIGATTVRFCQGFWRLP